LFLIVPRHPTNVAARFGVVCLCFCCPNRTNHTKNRLFCCPSTSQKTVTLAVAVCPPRPPYGEYFCFLSCPGTLPTLLRVLVWCVCVFVIQIAQTTPKLPVLLSANKTENRYFGSCSVAPRPPMVNIFVPYHASAVYEQCSSFWCALAVFLCFKFQKSHLFFCPSAQLTRDTGQKAVTLTVSMWPSGLLR
jgi:hypothetical protein